MIKKVILFYCFVASLTSVLCISKPSKIDLSSANYLLSEQSYIVQLKSPSAVELNKLIHSNKKPYSLYDKQIQDFQKTILAQQQTLIKDISNKLQRNIEIQSQFSRAYNGFTTKLTAAEADIVLSNPQVKSVNIDKVQSIDTDRGPILINADKVWNGVTSGIPAQGEGIIIGIIDSGVRADHPSFAAVSPSDGYVHSNPRGSGNYLGHCAINVGYCNDKLIGAYNYVEGDSTPDDTNGHGVHVASTAAGNKIDFGLGGNNAMQVSGVAPRANLIIYRTANDEGDSTTSAVLAAIEQAIIDQVDIINYSSGSESSDPWENAIAVAFRNARAAGIFVAGSAGNTGPNPATTRSPSNAPWITSVAASSHDRSGFPSKNITNMDGGDVAAPNDINGRSLTGGITAPIVYAANFDNNDTNPEQCLTPFPAGTFNGQIVVCDRGEIARVQKAKNVAAGGAGGYVLANTPDGATFLADDIYVIPGIHIDATNGSNLKNWLASGNNHMATITGTNGPVETNPAAADIIAEFSSRGPNLNFVSYLKPSLAAPGVNILAAGVGDVDWAFNQGTSMASPHVAGAAALIKQVRPDWSPAEIHSAIVTTANITMTKDFGINPANVFDMGGGRIDVSNAINAGLLLDETIDNFVSSDPKSSGDPKTLNLPGLTNLECNTQCRWSRRLTATVNSSWTVTSEVSEGLSISVQPTSFSLNQGETQVINITANLNGDNGEDVFGYIVLSPTDNSIATTRLPVAIQINNSNLKQPVTIDTQRDSGQFQVQAIETIDVENLTAQAYLQQTTPQQFSLSTDTDNDSAFDDLTDGVNVQLISVAENTQLLYAQTADTTATDLDLFVGRDTNLDGRPQESEILASSTSSGFEEEVLLLQPRIGDYWVLVQNWRGTSPGPDVYSARIGVIDDSSSVDVSLSVPSNVTASTPFNMDINFQNIEGINQKYLGVIALNRSQKIGDIALVPMKINRQTNDVNITVNPNSANIDSTVEITVNVNPNSNDLRNYSTTLNIPEGLLVTSSNISNSDANLVNNQIIWNPQVDASGDNYSFDALLASDLEGETVTVTVDHSVNLANSRTETVSASFNVTAAGTDEQNNNSSGGGSLFWILLASLLILNRGKSFSLQSGNFDLGPTPSKAEQSLS